MPRFKSQAVLLAAAAVSVFCAACSRPSRARVKVVASTSLIATIVRQIGGKGFEVTTIAPEGLCPGQFDLKPSDVIAANEAQLLLNQGWETWFPRLEQALVRPGPRRVTLETGDNWMIPEVQKRAVAEITKLLCDLNPEGGDTFNRNADRYRVVIDSTARTAKELFAGKARPATIASDKQASFLRWLDFPVVATYDRAEDFTAQELTRLTTIARDSSVRLIVDNLQSGPETGLALAKALKVGHVALSNFPLGGSYEKTLLQNADTLARLLK